MVDGESLVLGMSAQYHAGEQNIAVIVLVTIQPQLMVGKIARAVTRRLKDAMKIHAQLMEHLAPGMIGLLALLSAEEEIKQERDDVIALHHNMAEKTVLVN